MFPFPTSSGPVKMSTIQELKAAGEELGLNGAELLKFIRDLQADERSLRAAEREQEKIRLEAYQQERESLKD